CQTCAGTVIEYDHAAGNGFCVACGTVVEENLIVNEIEFGETSNGAAMVQGSYVAQGATHARMSGPYGNRGNNESREQTIANANKKIQSIANALRLSEMVQLAATRLYTLAVEHKFTKGRKSLNVVAVCLYVACRQKETKTYMLIDFSDLLTVNVFELGHTYLQLVQTLNLRLPLVDPSHYISRFAALLEFGDETAKVATDAVRLVQRFDRDWMTRGRRPAGICGAALLLAARMNNFRRSVEEIVQVVKIADTTLKKRLDEFKATPSGSLTLADFRNVWLEDEMDPPAYTKGREREEREREEREAAELGEGGKGKEKDPDLAGESGRRKRKRGEDSDEDADGEDDDDDEVGQRRRGFDASLLEQAAQPAATGNAGDEEIDELTGLDESELDKFLLSPAEVKIKERVWVELNRDYLEALAGEWFPISIPLVLRRKTNNKPRDASSAAGTSAAESVRNLIKKNPKYSKRINYDALKDLFVDQPQSGIRNPGVQVDDKDEEDGAGLYTLDDDKAGDDVGVGGDAAGGDGMVIIEEEASVVQLPERPGAKKTGADVGMAHGHEEDEEDEDEKDDEDGDGDVQMDGGWEEAWEQEV
ncbi:cyclin-like protein, partial [Coprinopsis sp. MPI-PUGE-AT-0042]